MPCNSGESAKITVNFGNGDTRVFTTDKSPVTHSCLDKPGGVVGVVNNTVVTSPYPSLTFSVTQSYTAGRGYRVSGNFTIQHPNWTCGTIMAWQAMTITAPPSGKFEVGLYGTSNPRFYAILDPSKAFPNNLISYIFFEGGRLIHAWLGCWNNYGYIGGSNLGMTATPTNGGAINYLVEFKTSSGSVVFSQTYTANPTVSTQTASGGKEFKINDSLGIIYQSDVTTCPNVLIECFDPSKQCPEGSCECIEGNVKCCIDPTSGIVIKTITL